MSLILSGTDGLSDVDGSAATPAIRGTDANTGIFFPAADTIGFATAGTEDARFDSAGNFGLGTSSPSTYGKFVAYSSGGYFSVDANGQVISAQLLDVATAGGRFSGYSNRGALGAIHIEQATTGADGGYMTFRTSASGSTSPTEQARIDSSGRFLVGVTSGSSNTVRLAVDAAAATLRVIAAAATTANQFGISCELNGDPNNTSQYTFAGRGGVDGTTDRAVIRSNGGLANYSANNVNLSDRREKTNFAPAKSYLDVICAIPVQTFNYIDQNLEDDGGLTLGVVAQDVQAVAPEMVMESNWGTEEEPKMRLSIYQTDLQYALMKCIQEQQALITQLTARITALETP